MLSNMSEKELVELRAVNPEMVKRLTSLLVSVPFLVFSFLFHRHNGNRRKMLNRNERKRVRKIRNTRRKVRKRRRTRRGGGEVIALVLPCLAVVP